MHNRPFRVINSSKGSRYTIACEEQNCWWRVYARKTKAGTWKITSVKQPHVCSTTEAEENHLQLNSRFIARQLCPVVKHLTTITVSALVEVIFLCYNYYVKYGKAWRAKQHALEIIFGDWEEAYERLPVMLNTMKAVNSGCTLSIFLRRVNGGMGGKFLVGHSGHLARALKHSSIVGSSSQLMGRFLSENLKAQCLYALELIRRTNLSHYPLLLFGRRTQIVGVGSSD
jgi:hypothetical protein